RRAPPTLRRRPACGKPAAFCWVRLRCPTLACYRLGSLVCTGPRATLGILCGTLVAQVPARVLRLPPATARLRLARTSEVRCGYRRRTMEYSASSPALDVFQSIRRIWAASLGR